MHKFTWLFIFLSLTIQGQDHIKDTTIITKTYSQRWELDKADKKGTFRLISYKPIYLTAGRISSNPNNQKVKIQIIQLQKTHLIIMLKQNFN
jgi:phospholipase A1